MSSIWDNRAWGTDICVFQDAAKFAPGVIDFGVARMNVSNGDPIKDSKFAQHIQAFYDACAVPMAYWVVNSSYYTNRQMTLTNMTQQSNGNHPILNCIQQSLHAGSGWKAVGVLWFDVEMPGAGDVWNAAYLEDLRNRMVTLQKTGEFPKIILGVYSRKSFIDTQPAVVTWLEQHPEIAIWTANYRTDTPALVANDLAQVRALRQPITGHAPIWFGDNAAKPKQYKRFWQYHGTGGGCKAITCPEISGNNIPSGLDLDIFEGTRKELFEMVGMTDRLGIVPPPPPPIIPPDIEGRLKWLEARASELTDASERINHLETQVKALETWRKS